jgi:hypothetical protein
MSLDAFALLRLSESSIAARAPQGVTALSDAVLFRTGASFAAEPAELAIGLRRLLGDLLDGHDDPRGVYFLPAAAVEPARSAGSYTAVLEAIGEAGMWVALVDENTNTRPTLVEALMARAMDGEEINPETLQSAMQASFAQLTDDLAVGEDDDLEGEGTSPGTQMPMDLAALMSDPAMMALAQKMRDLMPPLGETADDLEGGDASYADPGEEPTDGVGTELDGVLPMDLRALMSSPAFAELLKNAQDVLAKNPEEAQKLASRFGLAAGAGSDDEE